LPNHIAHRIDLADFKTKLLPQIIVFFLIREYDFAFSALGLFILNELLAEVDCSDDVPAGVRLYRHQFKNVRFFKYGPVLVKLLEHAFNFKPVLLKIFN